MSVASPRATGPGHTRSRSRTRLPCPPEHDRRSRPSAWRTCSSPIAEPQHLLAERHAGGGGIGSRDVAPPEVPAENDLAGDFTFALNAADHPRGPNDGGILAESWVSTGIAGFESGPRAETSSSGRAGRGSEGTVRDAAGKAVNRKVVGSSPCSGAKSEFRSDNDRSCLMIPSLSIDHGLLRLCLRMVEHSWAAPGHG
jgi:hypothetical protein